ncbi:MAG: hypothetical protein ACREME_12130 [Gemmatimonadales bacterium]
MAALGGAIALAVLPAGRLCAQVGHPPGESPFRDIVLASGPVVFAGYLGGDRGRAGAGPANVVTFGARYELPAGRSLVLQFSGAYLRGDRFILDPAADASSPARRTGPVQTELVHAEVGLQLRLTGAKSWRGLSPHIGAALGMAFDVNSPGDTTASGYGFRSKVTLGGGVGVRWYAARRVTIQTDARLLLWRLRYPVSFHSEAPDGSRVVPLEEELTDWTAHPWISLGIGWTF